jgi:hypothetical protein
MRRTCLLFLLGITIARSIRYGRLPTKRIRDVAFDAGKVSAPGSGPTGKKTVAVVITLLKDGPTFLDGATILAHSLRRTNSKFELQFYCIVTPVVKSSRSILEKNGYKVIEANIDDTIDLAKIPNEEYRKHLPKSGCCGHAELIKLEAFKLVDAHRVLLLDADSLVMSNVDELFEEEKDALWTMDRFLGGNCVNGGFAVFKPSMTIYKRMMGLVQAGSFYYGGNNAAPSEGKYHGAAWEGSDVGYCYGGQTFQGLLPFYFTKSKWAEAESLTWREVDSQIYNNMASKSVTVNGKKETDVDFPNVKSVHFTNCLKPWMCPGHHRQGSLCAKFHESWWVIRHEYEKSMGTSEAKSCFSNRGTRYQALVHS